MKELLCSGDRALLLESSVQSTIDAYSPIFLPLMRPPTLEDAIAAIRSFRNCLLSRLAQ